MSRDDAQAGPSLAFEPTWWSVTLRDGSVIELRADAAEEQEADLVFSVLLQGKPLVDFEMFRIPNSVIASWEGGRLEPRHQST